MSIQFHFEYYFYDFLLYYYCKSLNKRPFHHFFVDRQIVTEFGTLSPQKCSILFYIRNRYNTFVFFSFTKYTHTHAYTSAYAYKRKQVQMIKIIYIRILMKTTKKKKVTNIQYLNKINKGQKC